MSLEDRAEELASDLGADKAEVQSALENLVSYSVPLDEAVQSVRRKYGDGGGGSGEPSQADIADVTAEGGNVTVTGTVLSAGRRSIYIDGDVRVIQEGELADGTGKVIFTDWADTGLAPGDTVTLGNAGVREFMGRTQLNVNESTTVAFREEPLDVPYEVGGVAALRDLRSGDGAVTVEVRVIEAETREVSAREGEQKRILSGVVSDGSTRLPFTDWEPDDHGAMAEDASVRIENAHVKEFRGVPQVTLGEYTTVEALDRELAPGDEAPRLSVGEAVSSGGVFDVELVGSILDVREGSGLIQRCPECGRIVQKGQCRSHGAVEGVDDLRTKAILDDGTGTATVVLDDELTSDVYGGGLEDALEHARDAMDQEVVAQRIREHVVGKEYRVRGNLSVDDYGANVDAAEFEAVEDDPAERARDLLAEVSR
jgi:replication factor A1